MWHDTNWSAVHFFSQYTSVESKALKLLASNIIWTSVRINNFTMLIVVKKATLVECISTIKEFCSFTATKLIFIRGRPIPETIVHIISLLHFGHVWNIGPMSQSEYHTYHWLHFPTSNKLQLYITKTSGKSCVFNNHITWSNMLHHIERRDVQF